MHYVVTVRNKLQCVIMQFTDSGESRHVKNVKIVMVKSVV